MLRFCFVFSLFFSACPAARRGTAGHVSGVPLDVYKRQAHIVYTVEYDADSGRSIITVPVEEGWAIYTCETSTGKVISKALERIPTREPGENCLLYTSFLLEHFCVVYALAVVVKLCAQLLVFLLQLRQLREVCAEPGYAVAYPCLLYTSNRIQNADLTLFPAYGRGIQFKICKNVTRDRKKLDLGRGI